MIVWKSAGHSELMSMNFLDEMSRRFFLCLMVATGFFCSRWDLLVSASAAEAPTACRQLMEDSQLLIGQNELLEKLRHELAQGLAHATTGKLPFFVLVGPSGSGKWRMTSRLAHEQAMSIERLNLAYYLSLGKDGAELLRAKLADYFFNSASSADASRRKLVYFDHFEAAASSDPGAAALMHVLVDFLNGDRFSQQESILTSSDKSQTPFVVFGYEVNGSSWNLDAPSDYSKVTQWRDLILELNQSESQRREWLSNFFTEAQSTWFAPRFNFIKPLSPGEYSSLISAAVDGELRRSLGVLATDKLLKFDFNKNWPAFFYQHTVMPSMGPGYTVNRVRELLAPAIATLRTSDRLISMLGSKEPQALVLKFHYLRTTKEIKVTIHQKGSGGPPYEVYREAVVIEDPAVQVQGKVSEDRLLAAVHEFGHAYVAALLGIEFTQVSVASADSDFWGFVDFNIPDDGISILSQVWIVLASRAMERLFMSGEPLKFSDALAITTRPSQDIAQATRAMFDLVYSFGFDQSVGTLNLAEILHQQRQAADRIQNQREATENIQTQRQAAENTPTQRQAAERVGRVLMGIENHLIQYFLDTATIGWYKQKINRLARRGVMSEAEFYKLIGVRYDRRVSATRQYSRNKLLREFSGDINDSTVYARAPLVKGSNANTEAESAQTDFLSFMIAATQQLLDSRR